MKKWDKINVQFFKELILKILDTTHQITENDIENLFYYIVHSKNGEKEHFIYKDFLDYIIRMKSKQHKYSKNLNCFYQVKIQGDDKESLNWEIHLKAPKIYEYPNNDYIIVEEKNYKKMENTKTIKFAACSQFLKIILLIDSWSENINVFKINGTFIKSLISNQELIAEW